MRKKTGKWFFTGIALMAMSTIVLTGGKTDAAVSGCRIEEQTRFAQTSSEDEYSENGYTVNKKEHTITLNVNNNADITGELDGALWTAGELASAKEIYTVKVPAGSYKLSGITHIHSNTTLSMYGVTLTCSAKAGDFNMLVSGTVSYVNSKTCSGYKGFENITIEGGTWDGNTKNSKTHMRLFHATNVTVKDVTLKGGRNNHQLEVAAIDNFNVMNCTFRDMAKSTGATKREALQLDLAVHSSIYPEIILDGTMMRNVQVTGCKFINVSRGIGSHSLLQGGYLENIQITGNTFTNVEQECVTALNYYKADISNNTMTNCGAGVMFQYSKGDAKTIFTTTHDGKKKYNGKVRVSAASKINNNTIITKYNKQCDENFGVKLFGRKVTKKEKNPVDKGTIQPKDYYVSGVTVSGNTITASGYGIALEDAKKCTIQNNTIVGAGYSNSDKIAKQKKYNGIHLGKVSVKNKLIGNTIENVQQNGIFLQDKSSATIISGNTIKKAGKNGIHLYGKSMVNGNIQSNTISGSKLIAISIDNGSRVGGAISENVIQGARKNGIYVLNKSSVGKGIHGNTVKSIGQYGIFINNHGKVKGGITKNVVSKAKKASIFVYNGSKVTGKIKSNKVGKKKKAIMVGANASAKVGKNK